MGVFVIKLLFCIPESFQVNYYGSNSKIIIPKQIIFYSILSHIFDKALGFELFVDVATVF